MDMRKYIYKPAAKKIVRQVLTNLRHQYMSSAAIRDNILQAEREILRDLEGA